MGKIFFYHFQVINSRLKNKKFPSELLTRNWKIESSLRVNNSIGKLLFFHFRVTNLKLKNKKFYFESLIRKMKEQNLDFEVTRDSFIEMKYSILNYLNKNIGMLDFVILAIDLALNRYCLWSWDYSAHALRYAIVFFEKSFCY